MQIIAEIIVILIFQSKYNSRQKLLKILNFLNGFFLGIVASINYFDVSPNIQQIAFW